MLVAEDGARFGISPKIEALVDGAQGQGGVGKWDRRYDG